MTTQSDPRLGATVRARLYSTAQAADRIPDSPVTRGDTAARDLWRASGAPDIHQRAAFSLLVEYLVGFHGVSPEDALFEVETLPPAERRRRTAAAWQDVCALAANPAVSVMPGEAAGTPSAHP